MKKLDAEISNFQNQVGIFLYSQRHAKLKNTLIWILCRISTSNHIFSIERISIDAIATKHRTIFEIHTDKYEFYTILCLMLLLHVVHNRKPFPFLRKHILEANCKGFSADYFVQCHICLRTYLFITCFFACAKSFAWMPKWDIKYTRAMNDAKFLIHFEFTATLNLFIPKIVHQWKRIVCFHFKLKTQNRWKNLSSAERKKKSELRLYHSGLNFKQIHIFRPDFISIPFILWNRIECLRGSCGVTWVYIRFVSIVSLTHAKCQNYCLDCIFETHLHLE